MSAVISTARLTLRVIHTDDAPFYLELVNNPTWLAGIGDKGIRTLEAARDAIQSGPMAMQERLGYSLYVMQRTEDGIPMGLCGLIKRDSLPDTDIGYAILPRYNGQGYTYEAAAAVLAHARDHIGLKRLLGITSPKNEASNYLLQKLGLRFVRVIHTSDTDPGTNLYSISF
jgi:RimJ/RimL family protein N-acetyltransferase